MKKKCLIVTVFAALAVMGCAHTKSFQSNPYGSCKNAGDIDCLKKNGWEIREVPFSESVQTLALASGPDFKTSSDAFIKTYKRGDKTYFYASSKMTSEEQNVRQGYIILRNGILEGEITTMMNY